MNRASSLFHFNRAYNVRRWDVTADQAVALPRHGGVDRFSMLDTNCSFVLLRCLLVRCNTACRIPACIRHFESIRITCNFNKKKKIEIKRNAIRIRYSSRGFLKLLNLVNKMKKKKRKRERKDIERSENVIYISTVYFEMFVSFYETYDRALLDIVRVLHVLDSGCWNFVSRTKGSYTLVVLNISSFVHCYLCFLHCTRDRVVQCRSSNFLLANY